MLNISTEMKGSKPMSTGKHTDFAQLVMAGHNIKWKD